MKGAKFFMAFNFMDLLGSVMQGTSSPATNSRMNSAGSSVQDLLGSLMGGSSSQQGSSGGKGKGGNHGP